MAAFGWSVGDIIAAARIARKVVNAFKEIGGAASRYQQCQDFLVGLGLTLEHLRKYVEAHPNGAYISDLNTQIQRIETPWNEFKAFLEKYEKSLSEDSDRSKLRKAPRTVRWTVKDLSGEVDKLEAAISKPLQVIGSLMSLQLLDTIGKLPEQLLSVDRCHQIIDAVNLSRIPTQLEKRIEELSNTMNERRAEHRDEIGQLNYISQTLDLARSEMLEKVQEEGQTCRDLSHAGSTRLADDIERLYENIRESNVKELIERQQTMIMSMRVALEMSIEALQAEVKGSRLEIPSNIEPQEMGSTTTAFVQWVAILFSAVTSGITAGAAVAHSTAVNATPELHRHLAENRYIPQISRGLSENHFTASACYHRTDLNAGQSVIKQSWAQEFTGLSAAGTAGRSSSQANAGDLTTKSRTTIPENARPVHFSQGPQSVHSNASMTPTSFTPSFYHYSEATPTESSISTGLASRFSGISLLEEIDGVLEVRQNQRTGSDDSASSSNSSNDNGDVGDNGDGGNGDGAGSDVASSEKSTTFEHETNNDKKKREGPHRDDGHGSADIPQRPRCIIPSKLGVKMIRTQSVQQKVTAWLLDQVDMSTDIRIPDEISMMGGHGFVDNESQSVHRNSR